RNAVLEARGPALFVGPQSGGDRAAAQEFLLDGLAQHFHVHSQKFSLRIGRVRAERGFVLRSGLRGRLLPVLVVGAAAAAAPAVVHVLVGNVKVNLTAEMHFYSVGFSALVAAAAALGLTVVGARRSDTRTVLVGTAFAVMASLLALHGFS